MDQASFLRSVALAIALSLSACATQQTAAPPVTVVATDKPVNAVAEAAQRAAEELVDAANALQKDLNTEQSAPTKPVSHAGSFADNPIVYFVLTDRFYNGNPSNDNSYGRTREKTSEEDVATFHGGDLAGLTVKLKEGYFKNLGVNALWISAPYEQIHGWVVGGNKEFKHYAYHGYYALDYTRLDKNMGNEDELREFVDTAHSQGIRVLFDVVMNHPGYGDIQTLSELSPGVLWPDWKKYTLRDYHSFINYNDTHWIEWWSPDWIRSGLRLHDIGGQDDFTMQLAYLPDFKTESPKFVGLPPLLQRKADTHAIPLENATVRTYLVSWLTQWVKDYGIDGFRCDTVKHVEPASWAALKAAGITALADWKAKNPSKKIDDAPFWMTGEYWGYNIDRTAIYDSGFDNMINFDFQSRVDLSKIDRVYADYAKVLAAPATHNVLSYISSHDTRLFDRKRLIDGGTALLLAPGGVQIFYGDESGRPGGYEPPSDKQQGTRSDMNWDTLDTKLLSHWQKLTQFRAHHVALARGGHVKLSDAPYTFARKTPEDRVVVAFAGDTSLIKIPVDTIFADGVRVRDAYTATEVKVEAGFVTLAPGVNGVVLLEAVE